MLDLSLLTVLFLFCFGFFSFQDPRSNFATEKNKFLTSVPKVYAAGGIALQINLKSQTSTGRCYISECSVMVANVKEVFFGPLVRILAVKMS